MAEIALYLYGFTRTGIDVQMVPGVDGRAGVTLLPIGDVAALVSPLSAEEISPLVEPDGPSVQWVVPRARNHQGVLESVLVQAPVLPVRFGAVFTSVQTVKAYVEPRYEIIDRFLEHIADKEEWSVKARFQVSQAESWLCKRDPELAAEWEKLPSSQGARYFAEKRFRAGLTARVKRWADEAGRNARQELQEVSQEGRFLKLHGEENATLAVVWNAAFLLRRMDVGSFLSRMEEITSRYAEGGLILEPRGPWPPFNFCPNLSGDSA